jgi:hypothetical protein
MNKIALLLFVFITSHTICKSNEFTENTEPEKKVFMEGSLRLSFGDKTRLGIGPTINYSFGKSLYVGAGIIAEYYSNYNTSSEKFNTSIYGNSLVANYEVKGISEKLNRKTSAYICFEQEFLNLENKYFTDSNNDGRSWHDASFVGFKVKRKIGVKNRFALGLIVVWNLNNSNALSKIYQNPQVKLGFQF